MKRKIVAVIAASLLSLGLIATIMLYQLFYFANISMGQSFQMELKPGTSLSQFATQLVSKGHITHKRQFIWMALLRGDAHRIQSGEYAFSSETTPLQLLNKIKSGQAIVHKITFAEGVRFSDMLTTLHDNPHLKHDVSGASDLSHQLGISNDNLEGLFYPDTYSFYKGTSDKKILRQAYQKMQQVLQDEWQHRQDKALYQTPYEALIAASLVEKETAQDGERFLVATVIANRLQKKMRLQIDPTVIYGMGETYPGKLLRSHLKIPSPYNTYMNAGLPPTPIAMPSQASIHATLHPMDNQDLYYVSRGDGTHIFATNLANHQRNVVKVRAQQKQVINDDATR